MGPRARQLGRVLVLDLCRAVARRLVFAELGLLDEFGEVTVHRGVLVVADGQRLVVLDRGRAIAGALQADLARLVVLDLGVVILLGVDVDLLRALLVLEAVLVRPTAALAGVALDAGLGGAAPYAGPDPARLSALIGLR